MSVLKACQRFIKRNPGVYREYLSGDCRMKYLIQRDECPKATLEEIEDALCCLKQTI